jgi:hypothetical protein
MELVLVTNIDLARSKIREASTRGVYVNRDTYLECLGAIPAPAGEICAICREDFNHASDDVHASNDDQASDEVVETLQCRHTFHRDCITGWFHSQDVKRDTCPSCRHVLYKASPLTEEQVAQNMADLEAEDEEEEEFDEDDNRILPTQDHPIWTFQNPVLLPRRVYVLDRNDNLWLTRRLETITYQSLARLLLESGLAPGSLTEASARYNVVDWEKEDFTSMCVAIFEEMRLIEPSLSANNVRFRVARIYCDWLRRHMFDGSVEINDEAKALATYLALFEDKAEEHWANEFMDRTFSGWHEWLSMEGRMRLET